MTIETMDLEITNGAEESIEITLRGKPDAMIHALVCGLPREALLQLNEALAAELEKRRHETA